MRGNPEGNYSACRICMSSNLEEILDYGNVALADGFLDTEDDIVDEKSYPLHLMFCLDCRHVQISEILSPGLLFQDYVYETNTSDAITSYVTKFSQEILIRYGSGHHLPRVLEIASNDGTVLSCFKEQGCEILGIDPAENIASVANNKGIRTLPEFFSQTIAESVINEYGKWDIIIARNVIAHVKELHSVFQGIRLLLADEGFCVIEVPHLETMFRELQYDQVFHEHIGYHSLDSIVRLADQFGMKVVDVEKVWVHGGSIRVFLQPSQSSKRSADNVKQMLHDEMKIGLLEMNRWDEFRQRVINQRDLLRKEIDLLNGSGLKVAAYGASGKGQSMLQFVGLDQRLVEYVVDRSARKQGKLTPGTHIKIFPPSHIYKEFPDVILLCAWNLSKEIYKQEEEYIKLGGRILHPLPEPHYVA